jgi:hypothetical protein
VTAYQVADCARCGRHMQPAVQWEGPVCRACFTRATRTRGTCTGCATYRLLPGRDLAGQPVCRDCAAITRSFFCRRCRSEGPLCGGKLCERCTLTDKLTVLLDDGTGHVRRELRPLFDTLRTSERPHCRLTWLKKPGVAELLAALAAGEIAITHAALIAQPNWRRATFLRELLMHCGVLPIMDKNLMLFERWLGQRLAAITDTDHHAVVHRFATWNELRRLRAKAERQQLTAATIATSRDRVIQAISFLSWLDSRGDTLAACGQASIDAWFAENYHTRWPTAAFLRWAVHARVMPRHKVTRRPPTPVATITQRQRFDLIQTLLETDDIPLRERVAGLFLLLYAQPMSRIVRMTYADILVTTEGVSIKFGEPPAPTPQPLADLLREFLAQRSAYRGPNANTIWLFPGLRPDQPLHHRTLANTLRKYAIPAQIARTTTLHQLVLDVPATVVASMLNYHQDSTARLASEGGNWGRYARPDPTLRSMNRARTQDS